VIISPPNQYSRVSFCFLNFSYCLRRRLFFWSTPLLRLSFPCCGTFANFSGQPFRDLNRLLTFFFLMSGRKKFKYLLFSPFSPPQALLLLMCVSSDLPDFCDSLPMSPPFFTDLGTHSICSLVDRFRFLPLLLLFPTAAKGIGPVVSAPLRGLFRLLSSFAFHGDLLVFEPPPSPLLLLTSFYSTRILFFPFFFLRFFPFPQTASF